MSRISGRWGFMIHAADSGTFCDRRAPAGVRATGADINPRNGRKPVHFLRTNKAWASIVFNPPTRIAGNELLAQFVERAFARSQKTAFFMETRRRHAAHWLWKLRPRRIWLLDHRPSCPSVDYIFADYKPEGGSQDFCG
jgi:hypothetical protein